MTNKEILINHPRPYFGYGFVLDDVLYTIIGRAPQPVEIVTHDHFIDDVKYCIEVCNNDKGPYQFEYNNVKFKVEKYIQESDSYKSVIRINYESVWDYANRMDELGKLIEVDSINEQYTPENIEKYMHAFFRGLFNKPELTIENFKTLPHLIGEYKPS